MTPPRNPDEQRVRRASVRMTRQIALATVLVSLLFVAGVVIMVAVQSRPAELDEPASPGEVRIHINAAYLVGISVGVAVAAVLYSLVISSVVSRRAVRPLAHALEIQRRFVADASHELRAPLTVLDARVQTLQRQIAEQEPPEETASALRSDTGQLIGIVNDLLAVAGAESPGEGADRQIDASEVVGSSVESLRVLADEQNVTLVASVTPGLTVTMSRTGLRRCVTALVDNALGHCHPGGRVSVGLGGVAGRAVLTVRDDGPGIRGIDPERVFDRFAHADPPGRPDGRRGLGIGLALVRELAIRGGGDVRVAETGPGGTVMELSLPLGRI